MGCSLEEFSLSDVDHELAVDAEIHVNVSEGVVKLPLINYGRDTAIDGAAMDTVVLRAQHLASASYQI